MLPVEIKYANMFGRTLDQFKIKRTNPYLSNFRCPVCGDSDHDAHKARAYIIERKGSLFFYCHNCSASIPFWKLLKEKHFSLYEAMRLENFEEWGRNRQALVHNDAEFVAPTPVIVDQSWFDGLTRLDKVSHDHPAAVYASSRTIPVSTWNLLYVAEDFGAWVSKWLPDKKKAMDRDRGKQRLVIPVLDFDGNPFGCSARLIGNDPELKRYYTLFESDDHVKIFGLDRLDIHNPYVVTEGAIDSLFINNAVAMLGTGVNLHDLPVPVGVENAIFCFDNEPRNKSVVKSMINKAKQGYRVIVFPNTMNGKDINEMVLCDALPQDRHQVADILKENSYSGLAALAKISEWRRV